MQIGVTTCARLCNIFENQVHMAGRARHVGVPAQQRISRLRIVVKLGTLPDGRPAARRMTHIATNRQRPVWIACVLRVLCGGGNSEEHKEAESYRWQSTHSRGVPL